MRIDIKRLVREASLLELAGTVLCIACALAVLMIAVKVVIA